MRSVLKFVGECYATACVNPLQERINSSNVSAAFKIGDPETSPAVVERELDFGPRSKKLPSRPRARLLRPRKWRRFILYKRSSLASPMADALSMAKETSKSLCEAKPIPIRSFVPVSLEVHNL